VFQVFVFRVSGYREGWAGSLALEVGDRVAPVVQAVDQAGRDRRVHHEPSVAVHPNVLPTDTRLQGYLAHKKQGFHRALGIVLLKGPRGGAVSHGRGTPVLIMIHQRYHLFALVFWV